MNEDEYLNETKFAFASQKNTPYLIAPILLAHQTSLGKDSEGCIFTVDLLTKISLQLQYP